VVAVNASATDLLAAWEQGFDQSPAQRGISLLMTACPDVPAAALTRLSIGQRDALLLALREQLFGPQVTGTARCARCGENLEISFEVADIRAPGSPFGGGNGDADQTAQLNVVSDGYRATFRLPNSTDLLTVASAADAQAARQILLARCVLAMETDSSIPRELAVGDVPAELVVVIAGAMEAADPQANVQLDLACPACGHGWLQTFDIVTYLWHELDDWAVRTLREVHLLASTYGWSEREILAMTAARRERYLELVLG
jgi:hypothetical protein